MAQSTPRHAPGETTRRAAFQKLAVPQSALRTSLLHLMAGSAGTVSRKRREQSKANTRAVLQTTSRHTAVETIRRAVLLSTHKQERVAEILLVFQRDLRSSPRRSC